MSTAPQPAQPDLVLRRLALADADEWAAYVTRPEVMQHTSSTAKTVEDVAAVIERALSDDPAAPVLFAVRSRSTGQLLGTCGFHTVQPYNRSAEITYDVHPDHWGRGIAGACCAAAVHWGFTVRGWVRIQATTQLPNVASQAVLKRCGFRPEGLLRNFRMVRGQPCDYLLFATIPADQGL